MASNFRQFTNEINKGGVPTFENFQKSFLTPRVGSMSKTGGKLGGMKINDFKVDQAWREKEAALWQQRFADLQKKVKTQRRQMRENDHSAEKQRQKSFDYMINMKVNDRMQYLQTVENQRKFANATIPKQQRLYQRLLEKEKLEQLRYENKKRLGQMIARGDYNDNYEAQTQIKEILEDQSDDSIDVNHNARDFPGSSRKSKRSESQTMSKNS